MTGSVSYLCFEAVKNAARIGVYPERLHQYFVYEDSFERSPLTLTRIMTPKLFGFYYDFVNEKCKRVSKENREFLFGAFCNSVAGKLKICKPEVLSIEEIERVVMALLQNEFFEIVLKHHAPENMEKIGGALSELKERIFCVTGLLDPMIEDYLRRISKEGE